MKRFGFLKGLGIAPLLIPAVVTGLAQGAAPEVSLVEGSFVSGTTMLGAAHVEITPFQVFTEVVKVPRIIPTLDPDRFFVETALK